MTNQELINQFTISSQSMMYKGSVEYILITVLYVLATCLMFSFFINQINLFFRLSKDKQRKSFRQNQCVICLDSFNHQIATDCGHSFCGKCLSALYLQVKSQISCPACRQSVSKIFKKYRQSEYPTVIQTGLNEFIQQYNILHDTNFGIIQFFIQLPKSWSILTTSLNQYQKMIIGLTKYRIILHIYIADPLHFLPSNLSLWSQRIGNILLYIICLMFIDALRKVFNNRI